MSIILIRDTEFSNATAVPNPGDSKRHRCMPSCALCKGNIAEFTQYHKISAPPQRKHPIIVLDAAEFFSSLVCTQIQYKRYKSTYPDYISGCKVRVMQSQGFAISLHLDSIRFCSERKTLCKCTIVTRIGYGILILRGFSTTEATV